MVIQLKALCLITLLAVSSCATKQSSLYESIGGQSKVEQIVDNFIEEIQFNQSIYPYFADSNIDRFKEKMSEHLCMSIKGPCEYTGDSMVQVHSSMNISETDFNTTVDLLIKAMTNANVEHKHQNQILKHLTNYRKEIIYL